MKNIIAVSLVICLIGCSIFNIDSTTKTALEKTTLEPWYICDKDSLWRINYSGEGNRIIHVTDYSKVTKLRVKNIDLIKYRVWDNGKEELVDSILDHQHRIGIVGESSIENMFVPLHQFKNLKILDISYNTFSQFPYEIFNIEKLQALSINLLCSTDWCEYRLFANGPKFHYQATKEQIDTMKTNQFNINLKPYYDKIRTLKLIGFTDYMHHPDDAILMDSINKANNYTYEFQESVFYEDSGPWECFYIKE